MWGTSHLKKDNKGTMLRSGGGNLRNRWLWKHSYHRLEDTSERGGEGEGKRPTGRGKIAPGMDLCVGVIV